MIGLRAGLSLGLIHYAGPGGPQAWVPIIRGRRGWPLPWQHSVQMKDRCPPPRPPQEPLGCQTASRQRSSRITEREDRSLIVPAAPSCVPKP